MILFLCALLFCMLYQVKVAKSNQFFLDYCHPKNTTIVNGIFVALVFLSHASAKIELNSSLDAGYVLFKNHLLQLVVVTFLFYSGYGMCESLKKKPGYLKNILSQRFLKLLVHFDVAILLYVLTQWMLGKTYGLKHILLSFIGFKSVGNSNWYIFVILLLYIFLKIADVLCQKNIHKVHITTILTLIYITIMIHFNLPTRFYNTILCFCLGMYFSLFKEKIETWVTKNDFNYLLSVSLMLLGYILCFSYRLESLIFYLLWTFFFMALVLLFTLKVQMTSEILYKLGCQVFGIYILQRIPMNIGVYLGLPKYGYLFILGTFVITVMMNVIFNRCLKSIDGCLFK